MNALIERVFFSFSSEVEEAQRSGIGMGVDSIRALIIRDEMEEQTAHADMRTKAEHTWKNGL